MNPTRRGFLKGLLAGIAAATTAQFVKADDPTIELEKVIEPVIEKPYPFGVWDNGTYCGTLTSVPRNVSGTLTAYWLD